MASDAYPFDVSLVIVNWNTCTELEVCIRSFCQTAASMRLQVIVIDNASEDGSAAMVAEKFPLVILVVNSDNRGFAGGVNQGLERAQGQFVLVLNPDVIAKEGSLSVLVETLRRSKAVGAAAPRLVNLDGSLQKGYFRKLPTFPQVLFFYTQLARYAQKNSMLVKRYFEETRDSAEPAYDVEQIPGGCILVRREVLDTVGGMDERFVLFFEDVDWCYRMRRRGWRLQIIDSVSMVHLGGTSFKGRDTTWMFGRFILSLNQFVDKHGSLVFKISTKLITFSNSFLLWGIRMIQMSFRTVPSGSTFEQSYRAHGYLLKLLMGYYLKFPASWRKEAVR